MNPKRALSLFLILLALTVGGCTTQSPFSQEVDVEFTLETAMRDGKMIFAGVGSENDGAVNPDLSVIAGDTVRIILVNGDGIPHDIAIPDLDAQSAPVSTKAQSTAIVFQASEAGEFTYYCTVAGHRQMGMEGKLFVTDR
jgi:nitrite reductase (NO-forming)